MVRRRRHDCLLYLLLLLLDATAVVTSAAVGLSSPMTSTASASGPLYHPQLDLKPDNPTVEFGQTLELYCNILSADLSGNVDSGSICFSHNDGQYCNPPLVSVVNGTTAKFTQPNVTFEHDGPYSCTLANSAQSVQATQYVNVTRSKLAATSRSPSSSVLSPLMSRSAQSPVSTVMPKAMEAKSISSFDGDLDLKPNDPVVEYGKTLELTCHILPAYVGNSNSSSICFKHASGRYCDPPFVSIVNSSTAKFTFPNMTFEHGGHYSCNLTNSTRPLHFSLQSRQSVIVARRPQVPHVINCVAWNNLTCYWLPSYRDQLHYTGGGGTGHIDFRQTLMWTQGKTNDSVTCDSNSKLGHQCDEGAIVNLDRVSVPARDALFCVSVTVSNLLNVSVESARHCYDVMNIVKPDVPSGKYNSSNGTLTVVVLAPPPITVEPYTDDFNYFLSYKAEWMTDALNVSTNSTHVELSTLPASTYTVKVKVKPAGFGLWSDEGFFEFTSIDTAPSTSPVTDLSAFEITDGTSRKVTIYWKKLLAQYHFGPNFKYVVISRPVGEEHWIEHDSLADQSQLSIHLSVDENEISVISRNDVGKTSPEVIITVPSRTAPVLKPDVLKDVAVERNESVVIFHWALGGVSDKVSEFVLFWCQMHTDHTDHQCLNDIAWMKVPLNAREHTVRLEDSSADKFGVAAVFGAVSTGIRWATCTYLLGDLASPPTNVKAVAPSYGGYGELEVTWSQPPCHSEGHKGYILHFELHYCHFADNERCDDDKPVSVIVPGNVTKHQLKNLSHGVNYTVWMYSVTWVGPSKYASKTASAFTAASWATSKMIFGICFGAVIFNVLAAVVIWKCYSRCCKCRRQFMAGLQIRVPESYTKQPFIVSDSSNNPDIGYTEMSMRGSMHNGDICQPLLSKSVAATSARHGDNATEPDVRYVNISPPTKEEINMFSQPAASPVEVADGVDETINLTLLPSDAPWASSDANGPPVAIYDNPHPHQIPANHFPVNGGYLIVGPDTFGRHDNVDFTVTADEANDVALAERPMERPCRGSSYTDLAVAAGIPPVLTATAAEPASSCYVLPDIAQVDGPADGIDVGDVPPVNGTSCEDMSGVAPMSKYTVIVGVNEPCVPPPTERRPSDSAVVWPNSPESMCVTDPNSTESPVPDHSSISFGHDNSVMFCNGNGYLSYNELLGATAAVGS